MTDQHDLPETALAGAEASPETEATEPPEATAPAEAAPEPTAEPALEAAPEATAPAEPAPETESAGAEPAPETALAGAEAAPEPTAPALEAAPEPTAEPAPLPIPATPAIAALEALGVAFRPVRTEVARSAEESAQFQGIPLGSLLRSILVRRAADDFLFVLVPGGRRFNWPKLRALLGTNRLTLPTEEEAKAETGYVRGAITPFGARRPWPVIADASIIGLEVVAIGGGAKGINVHLSPADLIAATSAQVVDITIPDEPAPEVSPPGE